MRKNNKGKGEKGQIIVIGHMAKYDFEFALPMSDNFPWDFIAIRNNKFYKVQVKSADKTRDTDEAKVTFSFRTGNWWKKESKKYTRDDADVFIGYDFVGDSVYIFSPKEFENRNSFTIRKTESKSGSKKNSNQSNDYILSEKRIDDVFI